MLENLSKIVVENPVDLIISQIKGLIGSGTIKPGEKLPPERKLAAHLGVSRNQVREAIHKLQIYGIVKVQPQSGTTVTGIGLIALEGLLSNILKIEQPELKSLIETRFLLEKEATRLAALHRTPEDLIEIKSALDRCEEKLSNGGTAIEEDLLFHIKIAEASKNSVLKSLMMIITPDLVTSFTEHKVCTKDSNNQTINEHRKILEMIVNSNPEGAEDAMGSHLQGIMEFSKNNM